MSAKVKFSGYFKKLRATLSFKESLGGNNRACFLQDCVAAPGIAFTLAT